MANYVLSCCSTADLTKEHFQERNINCVFFHYYLNDVEYADDLGQSMPFDKFYQAMVDGAETRTSQVNADEFVNNFTPILESGKDIVHLTTSSGISGVYNSAIIAKEILEEQFPERKVYIVDSLAASSGYGLFMDKLADLRDEGKSAEEIVAYAEANKLKMHHWFFSTDLTFFIKGGRVSKVSGWFGTVLKICPLLNVSVEGKLVPREKIRTKRNVINAIVKKMEEFAENGYDYDGKCYISCSACEEDAQAVAALIEEKFPKLNGKVKIMSIGTTIGSHTGPGTVALFYWGKERNE